MQNNQTSIEDHMRRLDAMEHESRHRLLECSGQLDQSLQWTEEPYQDYLAHYLDEGPFDPCVITGRDECSVFVGMSLVPRSMKALRFSGVKELIVYHVSERCVRRAVIHLSIPLILPAFIARSVRCVLDNILQKALPEVRPAPPPPKPKERLFVLRVLTGPTQEDLICYPGDPKFELKELKRENRDIVLCSRTLGGSVQLTQEERAALFFDVIQVSQKKDYTSSAYYEEDINYWSWSYREHLRQVQQILRCLPSELEITAPGDGVGLIARNWQNATCGDGVRSPITHPRIRHESFSETMKRGKGMLFLGYVWNLMSPKDHQQALQWKGPVVIIDVRCNAFSPISPGVWGNHLSMKLLTGITESSEGLKNRSLMYTENLLQIESPKFLREGAYKDYFQSMRPLAVQGITPVHQDLEELSRTRKMEYFVGIGKATEFKAFTIMPLLRMQQRVIYYTPLSRYTAPLESLLPHEVHGGMLYCWTLKDYYLCKKGNSTIEVCSGHSDVWCQTSLGKKNVPHITYNWGGPRTVECNQGFLDNMENEFGSSSGQFREYLKHQNLLRYVESGRYVPPSKPPELYNKALTFKSRYLQFHHKIDPETSKVSGGFRSSVILEGVCYRGAVSYTCFDSEEALYQLLLQSL